MPTPVSRRAAPVIPIRPLFTRSPDAVPPTPPPARLATLRAAQAATGGAAGVFPGAARGRGAVSTPIGRFEQLRRAQRTASMADLLAFNADEAVEALEPGIEPTPTSAPADRLWRPGPGAKGVSRVAAATVFADRAGVDPDLVEADRVEADAVDADAVDADAVDADAVDAAEETDPGRARSPATEVRFEQARTILSRNTSPDVPFDRSINPYRGCEHGCIYCYARPNHAYLGMSPGLDFETRLTAKLNARACLIEELSIPGYECREVAIGAVTDAYQPIEREYRLTRAVLEVLAEHRHPVSIITKSALIERDIDLLGAMAAQKLAYVGITVTTLDEDLARIWEPRAAAPWRRLKTIKRLSDAGIPVAVMIAPIVPFINDRDVERIIEQATRMGARAVRFTVLRLPNELREVFGDWLAHHFPDRQKRVWARIEELRGGQGRRNDARFHSRMKGQGHWADLIRLRVDLAARKAGIGAPLPALRTDLFRAPSRDGQLGLF